MINKILSSITSPKCKQTEYLTTQNKGKYISDKSLEYHSKNNLTTREKS